MIHHVWDVCTKAVNKNNVIVLTDNNLIKDYCISNKMALLQINHWFDQHARG